MATISVPRLTTSAAPGVVVERPPATSRPTIGVQPRRRHLQADLDIREPAGRS